MSSDATTITSLYERIPLEAMQQVANSYMAWYVEKATQELDETIDRLRTELEGNDKQEAVFKPSASELESMRRLQSNRVNDVDLLDRLVERGEDWLVLTMQRLDYFERAGLSPNDYPAWCEHALSGAYDWIDASRLQASKRMFSLQGGATGPMRAVRPADLAAINVTKPDTTGSLRSEAAPAAAKPALAAQPTRPEPAVSRPAPAARAPEIVEPSTQPVPTIAQPAPTAVTPAAPEHLFKAETAPLPPPAHRPEPPRQPAPAAQAPQRPTAQAASPVADAPTRPTPVPTPAQEAPGHQRPAPAAGPTMPSAPPPPRSAPAASNAPTPPPAQRPQPAQPAAHAATAQAPQRPQPAQPAAAQQGSAQQPYGAPPKPRPSGANWNYQNQQADPRYSLEDVEVEDLEEEGDDQGLLRKIFRVFTG